MSKFTTLVSLAVGCAINFDDPGLRTDLCGDAIVKSLKRGWRVTGSRSDLTRLASGMNRHDGFDLSPSTIAACNNAARKIRDMLTRDAETKLEQADEEINPNDAESDRRDRGLPARDGTTRRRHAQE